jgi:hypothetical protein
MRFHRSHSRSRSRSRSRERLPHKSSHRSHSPPQGERQAFLFGVEAAKNLALERELEGYRLASKMTAFLGKKQ